MSKKLPEFQDDEAAKVWFDEYDRAPFMDEMEDVILNLPIKRTLFPAKPVTRLDITIINIGNLK